MIEYDLREGDCLAILPTIADNSIDSVVTDPPYHLTSIVKRFGGENAAPAQYGSDGAFTRASRGFMGKTWDGGDIAQNPALWSEVLRVLKPGGHCVAFSGTRTYHRMACAIEDAGFEVRDQLAWTYGQGFPKSMDISKAIDKAAGAEREKTPTIPMQRKSDVGEISSNVRCALCGKARASGNPCVCPRLEDIPATDAARQWEGWGTALKPAWEPICLARKPLSEKTVAANVLRWGTGALNIDACRVGTEARDSGMRSIAERVGYAYPYGREGEASATHRYTESGSTNFGATPGPRGGSPDGRWPANLAHDGSQEVLDLFPETKSGVKRGGEYGRDSGVHEGGQRHDGTSCFGDSGSAARFFYCAKASKADRAWSKHPTVKPVKLMQWLCRMVTPHGGTVLDPFAGSGTTGAAAIIEGFQPILIEREPEYITDIKNRLYYKDIVICGAGAL